LRPREEAQAAPVWALRAAVALAETLEPHLPDAGALRLKWPNDLMLGGGKLAGILCDSAFGDDGRIAWLVIGFGANLAAAPVVPGRATATLPGAVAAEQVARRLLLRLDAWRNASAAAVIAAWTRRGPAIGERLTLRLGAGETTGVYRGLDAGGALLLEVGGRQRSFPAGEVADGGS
jgi:BirA family biotin operon repressor/biotin-[acetyl-CoA-carboxylase] ligase